MRIANPQALLVGMTQIYVPGLEKYLKLTGNEAFLADLAEARAQGLGDTENLTSFFAKLCYRSLTLGKNANLKATRSIRDNLLATIQSGHGSVFEHCWFSFVLHDVSRVLTHELVRHRVGVAYSQESGRYCRIEELGMPLPSCIAENPEAEVIFRDAVDYVTVKVHELYQLFGIDDGNFAQKKRLTSAIRRIAPNGMANEIGFSVNLRAIRHIIRMRTNAGAEEEIRTVFNQIAEHIKQHCPILVEDAVITEVDNIPQWKFETEHL